MGERARGRWGAAAPWGLSRRVVGTWPTRSPRGFEVVTRPGDVRTGPTDVAVAGAASARVGCCGEARSRSAPASTRGDEAARWPALSAAERAEPPQRGERPCPWRRRPRPGDASAAPPPPSGESEKSKVPKVSASRYLLGGVGSCGLRRGRRKGVEKGAGIARARERREIASKLRHALRVLGDQVVVAAPPPALPRRRLLRRPVVVLDPKRPAMRVGHA